MINMIAYISVPYTLGSADTQRAAVLQLNKQIAKFATAAPEFTGVNAIYNDYEVGQPLGSAPDFKSLISACDVFVVVGNQFTQINTAELDFANSLQKPITFERVI